MTRLLMALAASLALGACAGPTQDYAARAAAAEDEANLQFMLNMGSGVCLRGIVLGCNFVRAYEYCRQGSDAACADARTYGRLMLTAASVSR